MGFVGLGLPRLEAIYGLTISPFKGIFLYSPILLLAFYGLFSKIKSKFSAEMWFLLAVFLAVFLSNISMQKEVQWSGVIGYFGPRHLLTMIPFLMIPSVFVFGKLKKWIIIFIGFFSIFINYLGASFTLLSPLERTPLSEGYEKSYLIFSFLKFIKDGPTTPVFKIIFSQHLLMINIFGLLILGFILFIIWIKFFRHILTEEKE